MKKNLFKEFKFLFFTYYKYYFFDFLYSFIYPLIWFVVISLTFGKLYKDLSISYISSILLASFNSAFYSANNKIYYDRLSNRGIILSTICYKASHYLLSVYLFYLMNLIAFFILISILDKLVFLDLTNNSINFIYYFFLMILGFSLSFFMGIFIRFFKLKNDFWIWAISLIIFILAGISIPPAIFTNNYQNKWYLYLQIFIPIGNIYQIFSYINSLKDSINSAKNLIYEGGWYIPLIVCFIEIFIFALISFKKFNLYKKDI